MASAAAASAAAALTGEAFELGGWRFECARLPISDAKQLEEVERATGVKTLPEMVFGANFLEARHVASGVGFRFTAAGGLARCVFERRRSQSRSQITVRDAERWAMRAVDVPDVQTLDFNYDWTYTTNYQGSLLPGTAECKAEEPSGEGVDVALLKRHDPIRWYQDVLLFEDELHDNGVSKLSVKVRVMDACFLILLRHWLRVDGVLVRCHDTRVFHKMGSSTVLREHSLREATFADLRKRGLPCTARQYMDADRCAMTVPLVATTTEEFDLAVAAAAAGKEAERGATEERRKQQKQQQE